MSADYCLHIRTDDITDDDMEGWFHNHLGSKYDPFQQFLNEVGEDTFDKINKEADRAGKMTQEVWDKFPGAKDAFDRYVKRSEELMAKYRGEKWNKLYDKFSSLPSFNVGEVSFLKAALFDDQETFIPGIIDLCCDIIDEGVIITDEIIKEFEDKASEVKNTTGYSVCQIDEVINWLKQYKGKFVFSIAW